MTPSGNMRPEAIRARDLEKCREQERGWPDCESVACKRCHADFLRPSGSRLFVCCPCKREAARRYSRKIARKKVRSGPIETDAFTTIDQVATYLSGDEIQCLECGRYFKALPVHIERTHGISAREYKLAHGIPIGLGLVGERTSALRSAHSAAFAEQHREELLAQLEAGRRAPHQKPARLAECTKRQFRGYLLKALRRGTHVSQRTEAVTIPCSQCGDPVDTVQSAAISEVLRASVPRLPPA